nr:septal ring lytic transglycosylase RlpA family protein [Kofleriaceae bacterium]
MRLAAAAAVVVVASLAACTSSTPAHPTSPHGGGGAPQPTGDVQRGYATFYNESQMTASGERFDKHAMTAAHLTLPFGTLVRVTNQNNGRSVQVRINDRGPYGGHGRIIDLSEAAAKQLQMIDAGVVPVLLEVIARPHR